MTEPMTPPVRTLLTPQQALGACWQAHQNVFGGPMEQSLLGIITAQSALETGRWRSMWCNNAGNIRGFGPGGAWTSINGASEIIDGKEVFLGISAENRFAAYPDAVAGFEGLIRFLGTSSHPPAPNRYQWAWDAAKAGDVKRYCFELRKNGYFTADLDRYTTGVSDQYSWLLRGPLIEFIDSLTPPEPDHAA